jgi:Dpy-30 motif
MMYRISNYDGSCFLAVIYSQPFSFPQLSTAGITRHKASLREFLLTIELVQKDSLMVLESSNYLISKITKRPTGDELEVMMKKPMMGNDTDSIQELLVTGLMQLCKEKPSGNDAIKWLGEWLIENNPNKPMVEDPED